MRFARRWRQSATSRETDGSAEFGVELLRPCSTRPDWRGVRAAKPPFRKRVGRHQRFRRYFFLPGAKLGCHAAAFWLGAAAMILIFSFLGFLTSRLPRCSPLAMSISLDLMLVGSWRLGRRHNRGRLCRTAAARTKRNSGTIRKRGDNPSLRPLAGNSERQNGRVPSRKGGDARRNCGSGCPHDSARKR